MMLSCKKNRLTTTGEISGDNLLPENSSSSVITNNIDLLRQILLRLPVKSLLVFKSVSKQWFSLISDPHFVHKHSLQNHLSIAGLFLRKWSSGMHPEFEFIFLDGKVTGSVPFKTLTFVNDQAGINIEQSCNGLLCCSSNIWNTSKCKRNYYIYNPSTKQYTILPRSQFRKRSFVSIKSVSLAFDPFKSPHYEVICIWNNDTYEYQIEIYSSKTASWRLSGDSFSSPSFIFHNKSGVFWNGSLHWISLTERTSLYFDIDQESVKTMPMPPINGQNCSIVYFGECRGHMHLIAMHNLWDRYFDIFEMGIDYTGWNLKYRVDLIAALTTAYPEMVYNIDIVDFFDDPFDFPVLLVEEEEESTKLVLQIPDKVISYDLKEMSFNTIHDLSPAGLHGEGTVQYHYQWFDAYQYMETLACV
ncbi:F-box domain [Macleaya cordata]|uniref:F-box domain n=1 Tax=Macleaya cordata TaxID=56857 RepID=A0A200R939_MACCD|nr:F-box domain [Macleaya cordata]